MLKARVTFRVMKLGRYVTVDDGGNYVTERLACRTGVIFAYLREQGRKRGEREARVACVGRFAKNGIF